MTDAFTDDLFAPTGRGRPVRLRAETKGLARAALRRVSSGGQKLSVVRQMFSLARAYFNQAHLA
jgi:hypothetical protein